MHFFRSLTNSISFETKIILLFLLVFVCSANGKILNEERILANLPPSGGTTGGTTGVTCVSNDCATCTSDSTCYFLNYACSTDSGKSILTDSYTQSTEYQYCKNAVSSGSINLSSQPKESDSSQSIKLSAVAGAPTSHSLCEWKIITDSSYKQLQF